MNYSRLKNYRSIVAFVFWTLFVQWGWLDTLSKRLSFSLYGFFLTLSFQYITKSVVNLWLPFSGPSSSMVSTIQSLSDNLVDLSFFFQWKEFFDLTFTAHLETNHQFVTWVFWTIVSRLVWHLIQPVPFLLNGFFLTLYVQNN